MSKLKSLESFKEEGLSLQKGELSNINGSTGTPAAISERYWYVDTTRGGSSDCDRCSQKDYFGTWELINCIEVADTLNATVR